MPYNIHERLLLGNSILNPPLLFLPSLCTAFAAIIIGRHLPDELFSIRFVLDPVSPLFVLNTSPMATTAASILYYTPLPPALFAYTVDTREKPIWTSSSEIYMYTQQEMMYLRLCYSTREQDENKKRIRVEPNVRTEGAQDQSSGEA